MPNLGPMVAWFVVVLALIPLSLWWLKRTGLAQGGRTDAHQLMRPVAQHVIGPGQKLMTVEVGQGDDKVWLVLGVTAQQITPLHTLPPQTLPVAATAAAPMPLGAAFAKVLHDRLQGQPRDGGKGQP